MTTYISPPPSYIKIANKENNAIYDFLYLRHRKSVRFKYGYYACNVKIVPFSYIKYRMVQIYVYIFVSL